MKFLISGSAGKIGYVDGQKFCYTDVEHEPRQWNSTGIGLYAYAFLHADDIVEVEAETIERGLERAQQEIDYIKALSLLGIMLDPREIWIDEPITERFLARYQTSAKQRIDELLRQAPLPPGITVDTLRAATAEQPRLAEVLGVIIETHEAKVDAV